MPFSPDNSEISGREQVHRALVVHLDSLYSTALRLTNDRAVAEDIVQETARKAIRAASAMRETRNVRAWLFKILVNNVRDRLRRVRLWSEIDLDSGEVDFEQKAPDLASIRQQDVRSAIDRLPPPFRALVLLVDIEGFTVMEAADMLGIPFGTAASRLARAHSRLRSSLEAYRSEFRRSGEKS